MKRIKLSKVRYRDESQEVWIDGIRYKLVSQIRTTIDNLSEKKLESIPYKAEEWVLEAAE